MKKQLFTFHYQGKHNGWYEFRATTHATVKRNSLDALAFQNRAFSWCVSYAAGEYHLANGNAPGYTDIDVTSALKNGNALCIMFKLLSDVVRFQRCFKTEGFGHEQIMAAAA